MVMRVRMLRYILNNEARLNGKLTKIVTKDKAFKFHVLSVSKLAILGEDALEDRIETNKKMTCLQILQRSKEKSKLKLKKLKRSQ